MEQLRLLRERHGEGLVTEASFKLKRQRILAELGIEKRAASGSWSPGVFDEGPRCSASVDHSGSG